jgi:hypothetical protein
MAKTTVRLAHMQGFVRSGGATVLAAHRASWLLNLSVLTYRHTLAPGLDSAERAMPL